MTLKLHEQGNDATQRFRIMGFRELARRPSDSGDSAHIRSRTIRITAFGGIAFKPRALQDLRAADKAVYKPYPKSHKPRPTGFRA